MVIVNDTRAKEVFNKYFDLLRTMGYVKHDLVVKIMTNAFLVDFLNTVGTFVTAEDYKAISRAYRKLFADGNCLMPYPLFCGIRTTVGLPTILNTNTFSYRQALNSDSDNRVTQLDDVRMG